MKGNPLLSLLFFSFLLLGCIGQGQKGVLEGKVTVGPLCPVEPCSVSADQIAKAYTSRNITVFAQDKATIVYQMPLNPDGSFMVELDAGTYYVTVRPGGIGDFPLQKAVVSANQTTSLNLDVDTGIR